MQQTPPGIHGGGDWAKAAPLKITKLAAKSLFTGERIAVRAKGEKRVWPMDYASTVMAGGAAICGLIASCYWYKSSNVSFWPDSDQSSRRNGFTSLIS